MKRSSLYIIISFICFFAFIFILNILHKITWSASITDWLSVFIYTFTLIAAIVAANIAKKALIENQRIANDNQRLVNSQTDPFVDIKLEIMAESVNWIRLKITNLGLSSAFQLKFSIENKNTLSEIDKKIIDNFMSVKFIEEGLTYLSKGDSRYTSFINLCDNESTLGFSIQDFLSSEFTIKIEYEDKQKKPYSDIFLLRMSDLNGHYVIGKNYNQEIIERFDQLNKNLNKILNQQTIFNREYEKNHRNLTEEELKLELIKLKRDNFIRKSLNQPIAKTIKTPKKMSIHEIRKQKK